MTSKGHKLTAIAFGGLIATMILTGHLVPPYPQQTILAVTGLWFAGIVIGSSSPDWLEMVSYVKGNAKQKDRRLSLIPHRTLTHWPPLWIGIAYLVWQQEYAWFIESFLFGFIASALLHIAMDSLSKSGVPILLPFAKFRMRVPLYSTGTFSEFVAVSVIIMLFIVTSWILMDIQ